MRSFQLSEAVTQLLQLSSAGKGGDVWAITGVAGFIGSHLLETLLLEGKQVVGIDNFLTGKKKNLELVERIVGPENWRRFTFLEGDIRDVTLLEKLFCDTSVDRILHQAALGSVPRSIENPLLTNDMNVNGFVSVLQAAQRAGVRRVVYASSSSVYGTLEDASKKEDRIGDPLSPYAASKLCNEIYAEAFSRVYPMTLLGLRYFNVFGPRQDPDGPYAAVIPRWVAQLAEGKTCTIYGDGETSRDFCYVGNVVEANIRSALCSCDFRHNVFNVAVGKTTTLQQLYSMLAQMLGSCLQPEFAGFRAGDVRHSLADISRAGEVLGYSPQYTLEQGLKLTIPAFLKS